MTAEVLREAAALMRERAEAASPAPWHTYDAKEWYGGGPAWEVDYTPGAEEADLLGSDGDIQVSGGSTEEDAAYIASWHPAVALAVADWLDGVAAIEERNEREMGWSPLEISDALAVARAYLGSDS